MKTTPFLVGAALLVSTSAVWAQDGRLTVAVNRPGVKISPMFYGLMTEEISHSYDGGLYAELIRNRVFKDDAGKPAFWSPIEKNGGRIALSLDDTQPVPGTALTQCLRLDLMNQGRVAGTPTNLGVANEGYWGIPIQPNQPYRVSVWAKGSVGYKGGLTLAFESKDGAQNYGRGEIKQISGDWKKYELNIKGGNVAPNTLGRFAVYPQGTGTIWLTQLSVMPPTYKGRANGLRPDLMEKMAALKPAYLRFPGGNYLEGITLQDKFDWKKTLGPIEQRAGHMGTWGYRSSDGLGMMEFLGWIEDLGINPVLAVHAGYALNGTYVNPGPDLVPYVQDALDEIEFVMGDAKTKWGKVRAQLGHPAPFNLKYVEIGNEDWFDKSGSYDGRYAQIHDAIKAKYPNLQLIATAPVKSRVPDVIDDHYYRSAQAMAADAGHYDNADRKGPKIFVGEWAATEGSPTPTLKAALGDAAWLTGLERNSDHVIMDCYAPLLVNVNPGARQWGTNLIGYDAAQSFGSPSFWMQAMFAQNTGDTVLPVEIVPANTKVETPSGKIGVGTWLTQAEYKDIKVTAPDGKVLYSKNFGDGATDWQTTGGQWTTQDGAFRQTGDATDVRAVAGDANWTDYDFTLKARKISGKEGFLVLVRAKNDNDLVWWNMGGWGNTRTAFQRVGSGEISNSVPFTVETNRWYDIKVEVRGSQIKGYIDGKLIQTATDAQKFPLYSVASRDSKTGDILLKVVNFTDNAQPLQIQMQGAQNLATTATGEVLAGQYDDVNSIEQPTKVAPKPFGLTGVGANTRHEFPARSVTVLRFKAK